MESEPVDRATRDKFTILTTSILTTGNACLETPPAIYHKLQQDFGPFDIDLTADAQNHLHPIYCGPGSPINEEDALTAHWRHYALNGYSNPPYGRFVPRMLRKAKAEAKDGFTTTLLLPMRVTKAFAMYIMQGATTLLFCDHRIVFWEHGAPKLTLQKDGSLKPTTALFDSIIVRYLPGIKIGPPRVGMWKVPPHTGPMGWGK